MTSPVVAITDAAFGAVGDGVADDTAAIQACLNVARGAVRIPSTSAFYKVSGSLTIPRGLTVFGDGADDCKIKTTSATASVFTVASEGAVLRDLWIESTVTRSSGAPYVDVVNGAGARNASLERIVMEKAATGVRCATGFVNIEECRISLLKGYGVGVLTTKNAPQDGGAGVYMSRKNFIGSEDITDLLNQPYAGLLLSDCGFACISSTHMLASGYGVLAHPNSSQGCTSLFFYSVVTDHCRVGWYIAGTEGGVPNNIDIDQCWGAASVYSGLAIAGKAAHVSVRGFTCFGNGQTPGNITNEPGIVVGDNATRVTISGSKSYDHRNAADISVRGNASRVGIVGGNHIGINNFTSERGVEMIGSCSKVQVDGNDFAGHTIGPIINTSINAASNVVGANMF